MEKVSLHRFLADQKTAMCAEQKKDVFLFLFVCLFILFCLLVGWFLLLFCLIVVVVVVVGGGGGGGGVCACVRACVRVCVRACVRVCVRACVWCVCVSTSSFTQLLSSASKSSSSNVALRPQRP